MAETPIIVVDDNPDDLLLIQGVLSRDGIKYPVLGFSGGYELLEYLEKVKLGVEKTPLLVVVDLYMMGLDGTELIKAIRADPGFEKLKIVVLSNSSELVDIKAAMEAGADGFHVKFLKLEDYSKFIASFLP